jgi:hypothetical protein
MENSFAAQPCSSVGMIVSHKRKNPGKSKRNINVNMADSDEDPIMV